MSSRSDLELLEVRIGVGYSDSDVQGLIAVRRQGLVVSNVLVKGSTVVGDNEV
jgi:hypothetical protein